MALYDKEIRRFSLTWHLSCWHTHDAR